MFSLVKSIICAASILFSDLSILIIEQMLLYFLKSMLVPLRSNLVDLIALYIYDVSIIS